MSRACAVGWVLALWVVLLAGCSGDAEPEPALTGSLRLGAVLGEGADSGFERAVRPRPFRFPADHGPHPGFRSEWWYLTFVLDDAEGRALGVQFTVFRQALAPPRVRSANRWLTPHIYLAHFALTDVAAGTHRAVERFARGHPELAGASAGPFAVWLEDWRLRESEGGWRLTADSGRGWSVDFRIDTSVPVVRQGESGLSRKGPDQASYYYSIPGMPVSGRVVTGGNERAVSGTAWLDREWSTSMLGARQVGWDWFALSLDDGRRVMLYQLRRADGSRDPYDQGMLVAPGEPDRHLTAGMFALEPVGHWTDGQGVRWPVRWRVALGDEVWFVEAAVNDQIMALSVRYWEGLVVVRDVHGHRLGHGYMELTGYGQDVADCGRASHGCRGEDATVRVREAGG